MAVPPAVSGHPLHRVPLSKERTRQTCSSRLPSLYSSRASFCRDFRRESPWLHGSCQNIQDETRHVMPRSSLLLVDNLTSPYVPTNQRSRVYASPDLLSEAQRTIRPAVRRPLLSGYSMVRWHWMRGGASPPPLRSCGPPPPACSLSLCPPLLSTGMLGARLCVHSCQCRSFQRRCRALTSARPLRSRPSAAFRC